MDDEGAARLAKAFGANLSIAGEGSSGMLHREATDDWMMREGRTQSFSEAKNIIRE